MRRGVVAWRSYHLKFGEEKLIKKKKKKKLWGKIEKLKKKNWEVKF